MSQSITSEDVQSYLDHIVAAGTFEADSLRHRLLRHLITEELAGRGDALKAYSIGVDVFDKPDTFDPSSDSSVRVGIGRLRTAVALFESQDRSDAPLIVDVPVGTYRPKINRRMPPDVAEFEVPQTDIKAARRRKSLIKRMLWGVSGFVVGMLALAAIFFWKDTRSTDTTIALEVENFTGEPGLAEQTSSSLRRALSHSPAIQIISDNSTERVTEETDLILNGTITRTSNGTADVSIELTSADSNSIIWAAAQSFPDDALLQSRIAQSLGSELRVRVFGATKIVLAGRDPKTLTPEQLFMMATWVPGPAQNAVDWELERVRLMGMALEKDPDFGSAHSVMADKLAYLANVYGPSNTDELRRAALIHAQRARELSPLNPDVMFNIAQSLWHSGQIAASAAAMERVVDLNGSHDLARFLSTLIPYTCSAPPDKIVEWAMAFDANLSKDNPIRWLTLTWISWLHTNRAEYEQALHFEMEAALIFEVPYSFMRHAMLLNKLGRTDDAAAIVVAQRNNWPDIDPDHFAQITAPRLCSEDTEHPQLIQNYVELAASLKEKL